MGMPKGTRRRYSPEDKAAAVKRHVLGGEAVSAVCEDLGVAPNLFYRWQKELSDRADAAFEVKDRGHGAKGVSRKLERDNEKLRSKLAHKDSVIAEITEDCVRLKKRFSRSHGPPWECLHSETSFFRVGYFLIRTVPHAFPHGSMGTR